MGCGGSKQDVATGNIRKKSETTQTTADAVANLNEDNTEPAALTGSDTAKAGDGQPISQPLADVKDIIVNAEATATEEGKLVRRDSPDRYFSSRKDDELVDAIAGGEYLTPRSDTSGKEGGKKEAVKSPMEGTGETDAAKILNGDPVVEEKKGMLGSSESETAAIDESRKTGGANSGEPNEAILVQEAKVDVIANEEKKKQGEMLAH